MDEVKGVVKEKSINRKLLYIITPIFLLSLIWFSWVFWIKVIPHETSKVHYHAGFIVVKNNQQESFTNLEYMNIKPCTDDENSNNELLEEDEQIEKAHLHDNVGDVAHVESTNPLWRDLFINLKYPLDNQEVIAYINGVHVNNFQDQPILPYQSAVIFIGENNDTQKFLSQAVTKEYIQSKEVVSEDCSSH